MDEYRHRKELFVSHLSGTSLYETACVLINICTTYFLCQLCQYSSSNFLVEYVILILPSIFVSTILSPISYIFHFILWLLAFIIYSFKKSSTIHERQTNLQTSHSRIIEIFRGQILIATCICILAVDFPAFPRRYAKTENYGYSGMDLGVGLFAFAHGMVSKQTSFRNLFFENFVLFILGLIRLISIKSVDYVEHVSEYGVHWNFFLTLCFMKLIGNCLLKLIKNILFWIVFVMIFHEGILLRYLQFDQYLINSENVRTNFIDANREGIYSLGGYICLYLIGMYIGRYIIDHEKQKDFLQMTIRFFIAMICLCALSFNPSRKLCNLGYVSSTIGLACMCIGCFCFIQWLLLRKNLSLESILLKNVNQKGLDIFLIANFFTGLINLNVNTLDQSNSIALTILMIYMFILTIIAYYSPSLIKFILNYLNIKKKK